MYMCMCKWKKMTYSVYIVHFQIGSDILPNIWIVKHWLHVTMVSKWIYMWRNISQYQNRKSAREVTCIWPKMFYYVRVTWWIRVVRDDTISVNSVLSHLLFQCLVNSDCYWIQNGMDYWKKVICLSMLGSNQRP